jgi:hypothetical protein
MSQFYLYTGDVIALLREGKIAEAEAFLKSHPHPISEDESMVFKLKDIMINVDNFLHIPNLNIINKLFTEKNVEIYYNNLLHRLSSLIDNLNGKGNNPTPAILKASVEKLILNGIGLLLFLQVYPNRGQIKTHRRGEPLLSIDKNIADFMKDHKEGVIMILGHTLRLYRRGDNISKITKVLVKAFGKDTPRVLDAGIMAAKNADSTSFGGPITERHKLLKWHKEEQGITKLTMNEFLGRKKLGSSSQSGSPKSNSSTRRRRGTPAGAAAAAASSGRRSGSPKSNSSTRRNRSH